MVAGSIVRETWFRSPISKTVVVVMRSLGFVAVALPRADDDDDDEEEEAVVEAVLPSPAAKTSSLTARCKVTTMPRIPPFLLRGASAATQELVFADDRLTSVSACKSTARLSRRQTDSPAADPLLFCCLVSQFQFQPPLEASFAVKPVEDEWFAD